eukprot:TRINITY_DN4179_c0_g1_i4.p2 TRINITY_DN4179_c0_g1~~TRINITY_DN4179_c0_g1_i4.p2  ORF type:complete len:640 (-),score=154.31 TRINITY_DN4179_c0_g1_i4:31-1950(-)
MRCPVISVPGFTFPVTEYFLEDAIEMTQYRMEEESSYAKRRKLKKVKGPYLISRNEGDEDNNEETNFRNQIDEETAQLQEMFPGFSDATLQTLAVYDETKVNADFIVHLIDHIDQSFPPGGAILVFLPGLFDITTIYQTLLKRASGRAGSRLKVLPLHSSLSSEDQKAVFVAPPPHLRKVILATNIAETSITVDDVVYVIDTGHVKQTQYDHINRVPTLVQTWECAASARQRRGRAGRTRPGCCFRLYTKRRSMSFASFQVPEIKRVPLEEISLQIKILNLGDIRTFFQKCVEPPPSSLVASAIEALQEIAALDSGEYITAMGFHLANLPVDIRLGKMILYSAIFGCVDPVLTIAACLSHKSPFSAPVDRKADVDLIKKKVFSDGKQSDHLTYLNAYRAWVGATRKGECKQFCHKYYLSATTLQTIRDMKKQFSELLRDGGFITSASTTSIVQLVGSPQSLFEVGDAEANRNSLNTRLVMAIICAGLYPNIAVVGAAKSRKTQPETPEPPRLYTKTDGEVFIHRASVAYGVVQLQSPLLVYRDKVKTRGDRVWLREVTPASPYALLLFTSGRIEVDHAGGRVVLDGALTFGAPARTAVLLKQLRGEVDALLLRKIEEPKLPALAGTLIDTLLQLLASEK